MSPTVSVLMPVHNGERYLREAVDSVLGQTLPDFEFIVVDDGSDDRSAEILRGYDDPRLRLIRNGANLGLARSLNRGLEAARGRYVARMDCDDVSLPERLARQVEFMDAHPEVAVCGTWAKEIDAEGAVIGTRETPCGGRLVYDYWRVSPVIHPSAMLRAGGAEAPRYDPQFTPDGEDYDLWLRVGARRRIDNLAEYLLLYRVHPGSMTSARSRQQLDAAYAIFDKHIGRGGITYEEFLALLNASAAVGPVRRARAMMRLARSIGKPYRHYVGDDLRYLKSWLRGDGRRPLPHALAARAVHYLRRQLRP